MPAHGSQKKRPRRGFLTIAFIGLMAKAGALISYGPNIPAIFRRSATYIDKILKGARPAELPVEQPTDYDSSD